MTSMEILHAIVASEQQARRGYEEALEKQRSFDAYIAEKEEKLRKEAFAGADERLQRLAETERERADALIATQEEKQERDLAAANDWYRNHREAAVKRVFDMVINADV